MGDHSPEPFQVLNGKTQKRAKKECQYGDDCPHVSSSHLMEFSHPHLESILDVYSGVGNYPIPMQLRSQQQLIKEQIKVIIDKQLYTPVREAIEKENAENEPQSSSSYDSNGGNVNREEMEKETAEDVKSIVKQRKRTRSQTNKSAQKAGGSDAASPPDMAAKLAASAPYHVFFTKITDGPETHAMGNSITFPEILDRSLGELECSLQITFLLSMKWLHAQYDSAGYGKKKLTILYDKLDSEWIQKSNIRTQEVRMGMYAAHHTKMMILCYGDGSLRVVVSTANLYADDWRNRTQGLWLSPRCPPLPGGAGPGDGESPTAFKRSLLGYLERYNMALLQDYIDRVKSCDFGHINVFLVTSVPGSHLDTKYGLTRAGELLEEHCRVPPEDNSKWPLIAQATSLGSLGKGPEIWLTGAFLNNLTKIRGVPEAVKPEAPSPPPVLKLIYPSKENVNQSYDGELGGGCLSYSAENHAKQPWLADFLHQWRATATHRDRTVPHIKCYTRLSPDNKMAAYFLLTSANVSKAAWGSVNKGNKALWVKNYEAGVLFLPKFIINEDLFPLNDGAEKRLVLPYDVPPVGYTEGMSPWISTLRY